MICFTVLSLCKWLILLSSSTKVMTPTPFFVGGGAFQLKMLVPPGRKIQGPHPPTNKKNPSYATAYLNFLCLPTVKEELQSHLKQFDILVGTIQSIIHNQQAQEVQRCYKGIPKLARKICREVYNNPRTTTKALTETLNQAGTEVSQSIITIPAFCQSSCGLMTQRWSYLAIWVLNTSQGWRKAKHTSQRTLCPPWWWKHNAMGGGGGALTSQMGMACRWGIQNLTLSQTAQRTQKIHPVTIYLNKKFHTNPVAILHTSVRTCPIAVLQ